MAYFENRMTTTSSNANIQGPVIAQLFGANKIYRVGDTVVTAMDKTTLNVYSGEVLSGGKQQRVAIARALVTDPAMSLCDEPTSALDAVTFDKVMNELRNLSKQGKAVVIVTHDTKLEAFADHMVLVEMGKVVEIRKLTNKKENQNSNH